jgi:hypothetical protein
MAFDITGQSIDFCIAWNWEYDVDFVALLESACRSHTVSLLQITPENLDTILRALEENSLQWRVFFDRASDTDTRYLPFVEWSKHNSVFYINHYERAVYAGNKAQMHLPFINAGIYTPYTIILPPYTEKPDIPPEDLTLLGRQFIIKPARGGGGEGVITNATSWNKVVVTRQKYPLDMYLLQAYITPASVGQRSAWFRVIYCAGLVYPYWWDIKTHIYTAVTDAEEQQFNLAELHTLTYKIADICGLELFSTEIALTDENHFVVVDYINDQIDLRLQSKAADGIPDNTVREIAERLLDVSLLKLRKSQ